MAIEKLISSVGTEPPSISDNLLRLVKQNSEKSRNSMATIQVGRMGTPDPDQIKFLTPALANMTMVQMGANGSAYSTLAFRDPSQEMNLLPGIYPANTPAYIRRTGSGAASINTYLPGGEPMGYDGSDRKMIQRRFKEYYYGDETNPNNPYFAWRSEAVAVPANYVLQQDERLDNSFTPGKMTPLSNDVYQALGQREVSKDIIMVDHSDIPPHAPYGNSFPTDGKNGNLQYSPYQYDLQVAWSGQIYSVPPDTTTKPIINDVTVTGITFPPTDPILNEMAVISITGFNLGGHVSSPNGKYPMGYVVSTVVVGPWVCSKQGSDDTIWVGIFTPDTPGTYDVVVVGHEGHVVVKSQCVTIPDSDA